MSIAAGSQIGRYTVVDRLGVGGMGEVWRASDERLGREVALKVLPDAVAEDAERLARFEREARTLAALSHPNIATLYGLEEADGRAYLVMELAPGEELRERLERGPIPIDETVAFARQIAEALEAAHEQLVIHRDLKPGNVKIAADGQVKVLDFGLAKTWEGADESGSALSLSPTLTAHPTAAGVILGTAAYMSPEQARGRPVDKRSDIWSFGVVVWEMLTGRRLFGGETVTDILASVLKEAPDLDALPPETPPTLRALLARCLERDPQLRLRDIGEARIALSGPMDAAPSASEPAAGARRIGPFLWALGGTAVGALAAVLLTGSLASRPTPTTRVSLALAPAARLDLGSVFARETFAISPDGRQVAFAALDRESSDTTRQLWIRDLGEPLARAIPGTGNATDPAFSPDGRWIAYLVNGRLFRVATAGGGPQTVAVPQDAYVMAIAWAPEGWILAGGASSLYPDDGYYWSVDADTGAAEVLHDFKEAVGEQIFPAWPLVLPDRRGIVFTFVRADDPENSTLVALDLADGSMRELLPRGYRPRLLPNGDLVYSQDGRLYSVPFDPGRLEITGPPTTILEGLATNPLVGNAWYELSQTGTLVAIPEAELQGEADSMIRVDEAGTSQLVEGRARYFVDPRVSPDGSRLAFSVPTGGNEIWVHDFERATQTRLSSDPGEDETPIWSPDGRWVAWAGGRAGEPRALFRRRPDGSGATERLWSHERHFHASDWTPDGEQILLDLTGGPTGFDIWLLPLADPESARPLLTESYHELHARLSPDGRWLAYTSTETGAPEVYVQSFPTLDRKTQVSAAGGLQATWSRDGKTLYFRSDAGMQAVDVAAGAAGAPPRLSSPRLLFPRKYANGKGFGHFGYDVLKESGFLMARSDSTVYPRQLELVLGWAKPGP